MQWGPDALLVIGDWAVVPQRQCPPKTGGCQAGTIRKSDKQGYERTESNGHSWNLDLQVLSCLIRGEGAGSCSLVRMV
jgi:hypothetical protein